MNERNDDNVGWTWLTLKASTHSCGQTVLVMAVPADGAMALAKMLYFFPSIARVRVKPMIAAFAVQ